MPASLKFIKTLTPNNLSLLQILKSFVMGGKNIQTYVNYTTYDKGDTIIEYNSITNKYEILACKQDGTTGTFDPSKWEPTNLSSSVGDLIQLSMDQPSTSSNKLWYQLIKVKSGVLPADMPVPTGGGNTVININAASEVVMQPTQPTDPAVKIWLDTTP